MQQTPAEAGEAKQPLPLLQSAMVSRQMVREKTLLEQLCLIQRAQKGQRKQQPEMV